LSKLSGLKSTNFSHTLFVFVGWQDKRTLEG
jgi:hypothetical protein